MSVWFCLSQKGKGRGGGGLEGEWEERDNKAGGDVNSQIGSFSCFPQPATLDGWLRQRPERIGETRAPLESWGNGGEGGLLEPGWGLWGGDSRRAARQGMAPGNGQLLEEPEEIVTNCLQVSPVCNLGAPRQHWRVEGICPRWITGRAGSFHPWLRAGRREYGSTSFFLSSTVLFALTSSAIFAIFPFCSIFPPFLFVSSPIVSFLHLPLLSW